MADQSLDGIGVLLNGGTGTFGATNFTPANNTSPNSVAVGNFIPNPGAPVQPLITADAALADDNGLGGVTIVPSDGEGISQGEFMSRPARRLRSPSPKATLTALETRSSL